MSPDDPFDLQRFVVAQAPVYENVIEELQGGRKQSHWMWFIFPQLRGLGHSPRAKFYGIASLDEARAYLAHPLLGSRLVLCTSTVLEIKGASLYSIFGSPDDMKFRSCMTLFSMVVPETYNPFRDALDHWCGGNADQHTLALLSPSTRG
ncbi:MULTISPECIES: DUF1810 domain-containing protein [Phyllobacterium]|jgi:uncharacterized protein (DUF1810 family)|uniref:DUF1810 domain-containing protein n=1 Tax=Phyllobacterium sophorae TaxID=1520277 RepID=A0A2P7BLG4_9HYPH|nr:MULTISPECIES: DUF1810 domain-containing protein [Phyllobacterium]PSH67313.1 DUF1810 domain-containing protein [Phyllobacterium sophorae]UXN65535.1 DUF1810 domain-containing protein [Phyllobacterium sp. A18/5-2]